MRPEKGIKLGSIYKDKLHGIEGVAISRHLYIHGCERVTIQWCKDGDLKNETFDIGQLEYVGPKYSTARPAGAVAG